jgi:hypothetical protein
VLVFLFFLLEIDSQFLHLLREGRDMCLLLSTLLGSVSGVAFTVASHGSLETFLLRQFGLQAFDVCP